MKDTFDQLGKARSLGHGTTLPENHVFGVGGKLEDEGAWSCIQGSYSAEEQQPDADLGKPVSHGWRNVTTESRAFGVPSIRADITPPERRSVADNQNYGDDVNAQFLLYPDEFSANGVADEEFSQSRTQDDLRRLFSKIGYSLDEDVFQRLWNDASDSNDHTPTGSVSIEEFRNALNVYLEVKDEGPAAVARWRQRTRVE